MAFQRTPKPVFRKILLISQLKCFATFPYSSEKHLQNLYFIPQRIGFYHSASSDSRDSLVSVSGETESSNKIFPIARNGAQKALFDYLHGTRSYDCNDAEYISKNSPIFLKKLLSKIESEQDVRRSVSKYLRYKPINEFEPFFESLGLGPADFSQVLPRNLMFLNDDHTLLENFHVLYSYGIPRSNMGLMYKEAGEIFRYGDGVLASKLQAYENLGLSKSTVIKLVSLYPSLLIGGVNRSFLKVYNKLKESGLKNDWIGGHLSSKNTYQWNRMIDAIEFLSKVGYEKEQMGDLFKRNPALLFEGSGKSVYALWGRLLKLGLKMDTVFSLFMQNPQIVSTHCVKNLLQALSFLIAIGMKMEDIALIVSTYSHFLSSNTLKGPNTVFKNFKAAGKGESFKMTKDSLCEMIKEDPLKWLSFASRSKNGGSCELSTDYKGKKATFLLKLGYTENSDEMMAASRKFRGKGDELQERFDSLVEAGLDCNVVSNMVRRDPRIVNISKDALTKKIDFLRSIGYPLESLTRFPSYLLYNMERINIRMSMYQWVRDKGAAKPTVSMSTIVSCSEARFVKYFVDVHPEGPAMWDFIKKSSEPSEIRKMDAPRHRKVEKARFLLKLGYTENSDKMMTASKKFRGRGDQL